MLPKKAVKKFLSRPRHDLRRYMDLSDKELTDLAKQKLPILPPIWFKLRTKQKLCVLLGAVFGRLGIWADTGFGKTLTAIALAWYFRKAEGCRQFLVLVPNRVNCEEWALEVKKHAPNTRCRVLEGGTEDKWELLMTHEALINITTYMGLVRMVTTSKKDKKGRARLKLNKSRINHLLSHFDGLIMDESTSVGEKTSLPYRLCRQIIRRCQRGFPMSGTPFGRDVTKLWSQMSLVDDGYTLGETVGLFRAAFFSRESDGYGYKYEFKKRMSPLLQRVLAHRSLVIPLNKADLPAVVQVTKRITLPLDVQDYIERARATLRSSRGNFRECKNAFLRLRQISSGFIGYVDDDDGSRAQLVFDANPKLELLSSIVASIQPDYKIVVWHDFIVSGDSICKALKDLGIGHVRIQGGMKDPGAARVKFQNDRNARVLVVNSAAGAFGLNLQFAAYTIYYESPVPVILRKQTMRRVERQGSEFESIVVYDLVCNNTADDAILAFHKEGEDLLRAVLRGTYVI